MVKQYDKGYLQGQLDEAEVALENVQHIIDDLTSRGVISPDDIEGTHASIYRRDLEAFLKENKRI